MSGPQRAAVALYALAAEDRELILAELPPQDQEQLRRQLREMHELGFEQGAVPMLEKAAAPAVGKADALAQADAAVLFGILEHEPAALVAEVLALREWRCRDALLQQFPAARRSAISVAAAGRQASAPVRREWLEQALRQRLAAVGKTPRVRAAGWRARLQKALAWNR